MLYTVSLRREVRTDYEVEADNEDDAAKKAEALEFASEGIETDCMNWHVVSVKESR